MLRAAVLLALLVAAGEATRHISKTQVQPKGDCEWNHRVGIKTHGEKSFGCGGVLISKEWVLTSLTCFRTHSPHNLTVVALDNTWSSNISVAVENQKWKQFVFYDHNMKLLKLEKPVEFNVDVRLPTADVAVGASCCVTGWVDAELPVGWADAELPVTIQQAVNVIDNANWLYEEVKMKEDKFIAQPAVCGHMEGQQNMGFPLVCDGFLHGVNNICSPEYPQVFSRVYTELGWIETILKDGWGCDTVCESKYCFMDACKGCAVCKPDGCLTECKDEHDFYKGCRMCDNWAQPLECHNECTDDPRHCEHNLCKGCEFC